MQTSVNPDAIYCKLTQKPENNANKIIWAVQYGQSITNRKNEIPTGEGSSNDLILKTLAKRRATVGNDSNFSKEVPQLKELNGLDKYKPQDCNSLVSSTGGNPSGPRDNSTWAKAVQSMGKWYESNIHNYNQGQYTSCSLLGGQKVRHDCSGFVSACLQYFGAFKKGFLTNSSGFVGDSSVSNMLTNGGFRQLEFSWDKAQEYDIVALKGHVEILASKGSPIKDWGWGSCHDGRNGHQGMPANADSKRYTNNKYLKIWRYLG
jgi:hypothetical protein